MLNPDPVFDTLVPGSVHEIIQAAVTSREPDRHIATDEEFAWWLGLQERLEIRADLAAKGLL